MKKISNFATSCYAVSANKTGKQHKELVINRGIKL